MVTYLRRPGHEVTSVGHEYPCALIDKMILAIATIEQRVVLTNDKDFGDLIFRDRLPHAGVILFRLGYVPIDVRIAHLHHALFDYTDQLDQFIGVIHRDIRVRSSD